MGGDIVFDAVFERPPIIQRGMWRMKVFRMSEPLDRGHYGQCWESLFKNKIRFIFHLEKRYETKLLVIINIFANDCTFVNTVQHVDIESATRTINITCIARIWVWLKLWYRAMLKQVL